MSFYRGLHLKTAVMILLMVTFGPLGNVLLGKGMKGIGSAAKWAPSDLLRIFFRVFTSGYVWLGIACLAAFFVSYLCVLSWADYSYVQPISSIAYLAVAVLAYFLLGEKVTPLHWIGIAVICLGVFAVGFTPHRTSAGT